MTANTAGETHPELRIADIGWLLFEMNVEYDYLHYNEHDEIIIAHANGLVLLGPGEGIESLMETDWWQSVV